MTGPIFGTAYVDGIGLVYVEAADRPDYLYLTHIKSGHKYLRRRTDISFRPAKHKATASH